MWPDLEPLELKVTIENYIAKNGGFHIPINNTGGPRGGAIENATLEQFTTAFEMHLLCNQIGSSKTEQFGRIINVISTSVKEPIEGLGVSNTIRNGCQQLGNCKCFTWVCHSKITSNN